MTEQELLRAKKKVDDAKIKVSQLEGQQIALMKQLKEYGVTSHQALKTLITTEIKKKDNIDDQIDEGLEKLEQYNFD